MKKYVLMLVTAFMILIPLNVNASEYHSYGVTNKEQSLIGEEKAGKKDIFNELEYRFLEKEDKDTVDYLILIGLITGMVIVIIFKNKKTYIVVKRKETEFLEEPKKEEKEEVKEEKKESKKTEKKKETKKVKEDK